MSEILPEQWVEVSKYRDRKYKNESLQNLRTKKHQFDACVTCPAFRVRIIDLYGGEFVLTSCIFFNKCIKQYPHRVDNKEFK